MPDGSIASYRDLDVEALDTVAKVNPKRGLRDHIHSVAFIREFPIGTTLSSVQFDDFSERQGLLTVPRNVSKSSIAWKAHLLDRHHAKMRINRGGTHPRLLDEGLTPFSVDSVGQGVFEVRSPQAAIVLGQLPAKLQSLVNTKHRHLIYLMQSLDWTRVPEGDRIRTETMIDHIEELRDRLNVEVERIDRQYQKLDLRIRRRIEAGELPALTHELTT